VHGEDDPTRAADVQIKLQATSTFNSVSVFNAYQGTPSLALLQQYSVVFVFRYGGFQSTSGLGDVLAEYWDNGGAVVVAYNAVITLNAGRFGTALNGYILLDTSGATVENFDTLGTLVEPNSPLLIGVSTLTASFSRSSGAVINGGLVVATWSSGYPLVVRKYRDGRPLVALNMWPPSSDVVSSSWSGNGAAMMRNALLYATCTKTNTGLRRPPTLSPGPIPSCPSNIFTFAMSFHLFSLSVSCLMPPDNT
jgi:hypothetical protein